MSAAYPSVIPSFTTKVDQTDINWANDVNRLQDEVVALARELGTTPKAGFVNVAARLQHLQTTKSDVGHTHDARYVRRILATSKGAMVVASGENDFETLEVGTPGQVPTADPTQTTGVRWATITHSSLPGLANDDHPQYLNEARHNALSHEGVFSSRSIHDLGDVDDGGGPSSGDVLRWDGTHYVPGSDGVVSSHGGLTGLENDDHPQYLNEDRHDDAALHNAIGISHTSLTDMSSGNPHPQYPRKTASETVSGEWEFTGHPLVNGNRVAAMMDGGRRIYIRASAPSGTVSNGDIWFRT